MRGVVITLSYEQFVCAQITITVIQTTVLSNTVISFNINLQKRVASSCLSIKIRPLYTLYNQT